MSDSTEKHIVDLLTQAQDLFGRDNQSALDRAFIAQALSLAEQGLASLLYARSTGYVARFLIELGRFSEAKDACEQFRAAALQHSGERKAFYADSLYTLGLLYERTGDFASAVPLYEKAIAICGDDLGEDDESTKEYCAALNALKFIISRRNQGLRAERVPQEEIARLLKGFIIKKNDSPT